jgi:hypothetical protein
MGNDAYGERLRRLWTFDSCLVLFHHAPSKDAHLVLGNSPIELENRPSHPAEEDKGHCSVFRVLVRASEDELSAYEQSEEESIVRRWCVPATLLAEKATVERVSDRCRDCNDEWLIPTRRSEPTCGRCYFGSPEAPGGIDWELFHIIADDTRRGRDGRMRITVNWLQACVENHPRVHSSPHLIRVLQRTFEELMKGTEDDDEDAHEIAAVLAEWTQAMRDWRRGRSVVNIWEDIRARRVPKEEP